MAENPAQPCAVQQGDPRSLNIAEQSLLAIKQILEMPHVADIETVVNDRVLFCCQPVCQLLGAGFARDGSIHVARLCLFV